MKLTFLLFFLFSQALTQHYKITILNDIKSVENKQIYLAWTIPLTSEYQSYYFKKDGTTHVHTQSTDNFSYAGNYKFDLSDINPYNNLAIIISFDGELSDVNLSISTNQKMITLPDEKPLYWGGEQSIQNSYNFVRSLVDEMDDEKVLYNLLLLHKMNDENFSFFKQRYESASDQKQKKKLIYWIGKSQSEKAIAFLINKFNQNNLDQFNNSILYALYKHNSTEAIDFLNHVVLNNENTIKTRKDAIYYLRKTETENLNNLFNNYLSELKNHELLKSLIYNVYKSKITDSKSILTTISNSIDYSEEIRKEAIYYLYKSSSLSDLLQTFQNISESNLRKSIIYHIYKIKNKESFNELVKILNNTETELNLRKEALHYVSKTDSDERLQIISKIASNKDNDYQLRKEAIYKLYKLDAFNVLKQFYIVETDEKLKKEILYYCYKLDSEESITFLAQLINLPTTSSYLKKQIVYYLGKSKRDQAKTVISNILN